MAVASTSSNIDDSALIGAVTGAVVGAVYSTVVLESGSET